MVPLVTDAEKTSRRQKVKQKRRKRGKKARPLPPKKPGADQGYKEFKIVAFYDETQEHRLVCGTRGDCEEAGRLMRREAGRIRLDQADEKVGNVDGSPWIRNQVERQSLPLDDLGLDFYHLGENVHKARREIYGEDDEAGKEWAGELLHGSSTTATRRPGSSCWSGASGCVARPAGGGPAAELRERTAGDDPVPGVPSQGLADRQRPDRGDVQDADGAAEGLGDALGRRQRRGPHGPGSTDAERPMGRVLAKPVTANGLSTPGSFARPAIHRRLQFVPDPDYALSIINRDNDTFFFTLNIFDSSAAIPSGTLTPDGYILTLRQIATVPEPSTLAGAVLAGLFGLGYAWRRRGKREWGNGDIRQFFGG